MAKYTALIIGCLIFLSGTALSQEVVVSDFPLGIGHSISPEIFAPYRGELKAVADTLRTYPLALAVVTGSADGVEFRENHDAKNPGLALGRAHALRSYLIEEFGIDSNRIVIQTKDVLDVGPQFRSVSIRVARELSELEARLDAVEKRPTAMKDTRLFADGNLGLQFGAGLSSSPFGAIPIITGGITWKRSVCVEAVAGHTFWNGTFRFEDSNLDTKRRLIGGRVLVYPWSDFPVAFTGGWIRIEEISQEYYEYVRLSEGPMLGVRVNPFEFLDVTGSYNPSKRRVSGREKSTSENDQFLVSVAAHLVVGGEK